MALEIGPNVCSGSAGIDDEAKSACETLVLSQTRNIEAKPRSDDKKSNSGNRWKCDPVSNADTEQALPHAQKPS